MGWCGCHDSPKTKARGGQVQPISSSGSSSPGANSKPKPATRPRSCTPASASSGSGSSTTTGAKEARQKAIKTFILEEGPTWVGARLKKQFMDTTTKKLAMFEGEVERVHFGRMDGRSKSHISPECPCTGEVEGLITGSRGGVWAHVVYDDDDEEDLYLRSVLPLVAGGLTKAKLGKTIARFKDIK